MSRSTMHTFVALLFAISGATGLVYQIVWFKYLSLFLGNTTYAQAVVLAAFMGGLAIGSALWGRYADGAKHLVRSYALLEIGIGLYGICFPLLYRGIPELIVSIVGGMELAPGGVTILALKLAVGIIMLLPPTILMGGTLPILVCFISERLSESGRVVAALYFLNSFGAVLGSLLGGFFLLRLIGLQASILFTSLVSFAIGALALLIPQRGTEPAELEIAIDDSQEEQFSEQEVRLALLVAATSGAASMIYEVTWVRMLIPVLGSSIYSFSIMLVGFISGITLGSLIVSRMMERTADVRRMLSWCQIGAAFAMIISLFLFARVPYFFWTISTLLAKTDSAYPLFLLLQFGLVLALMLAPTVFLGMSLPIATRIASRGLPTLGRNVGTAFSVNTVGAVAGSLLAGLVLMPTVGVRHTLEVGIALNLIGGVLFIWRQGSWAPWKRIATIVFVASAAMGALMTLAPWGPGMMLSGVFRRVNSNTPPPASYSDFVSATEKLEVLYYQEGTTATVGVVRGSTPEGPQQVLIINGKADASSRGDLATQVALAELPMLLRPQPSNVLIVGLGSGVTLGSVLRHPVLRAECVEISPEVVEASAFFADVNGSPLGDPRTMLVQEDALAYLKLSARQYDVIISEPSNPWIAGVGNLFTTEFFSLCRRRMNPGGLMVQWFHLYEIDSELFRLTLRTFRNEFRSVTMWQSQTYDVVLIGSDTRVIPDEASIRRRMAVPAVQEDLRRIGIEDYPTFASLHMLSDDAVKEYAGAGLLNSEDRPHLEYGAPRAFFVNAGVNSLSRADERMMAGTSGSLLADRARRVPLTAEEQRRVGMFHTSPNRGNLLFGYSLLCAYAVRFPGDLNVLDRLVTVANALKRPDEEAEFLQQIARRDPDNPEALTRWSWAQFLRAKSRSSALTSADIDHLTRQVYRSISLVRDTVDRYRVQLADMFFNVGAYGKASDNYARALAIRQTYRPDSTRTDDALFLQIARSLLRLGKIERALGYALTAARVNPANADAIDFIYDRWAAPPSLPNETEQRKTP